MTPGTLVFPIRGKEVLLGMKKRRFGTGKWNGFGGKLLEGEDEKTAVVRELEEECGLVAKAESLEHAGRLSFRSAHNPALAWDVDVFLLRAWEGEPLETEEMHPEWHAVDGLPFEAMWPDDPYWLPQVLRGEKIRGEFDFDPTEKGFEKISVKPWQDSS